MSCQEFDHMRRVVRLSISKQPAARFKAVTAELKVLELYL